MSRNLSRRRFIKNSVLGTSLAALGTAGCSVAGKKAIRIGSGVPAGEKIRVGFIGVGNRASRILQDLLKEKDVEVTAICDIWKAHLDKAIATCKGKPKPYHSYQKMLADDVIDAVVIGTPPHWHAIQAIHSCQAGKDFYLEKPMTLTIAESLAMRNAVSKHKIISQIGTQIHASENYRRAVEIVRSDRLGKINVVRTFNMINQRDDGIGNTPDSQPPKGLDWNRWIGPVQMRPFNAKLAEGAYHHPSFKISGGWTPGMAPHIVDLPYWALELGHPIKTSSHGGRYVIKDCGNNYDTQDVIWQYPNNMNMTWMSSMTNSYGFDFQRTLGRRRRLGIYFHGVNATLLADYGSCRVVPEDVPKKIASDPEKVEKFVADWTAEMDKKFPIKKVPSSPGHYREWIDGIRTRKQPLCCVDYHYKIDIAINLSLMAMQLGRTVQFDPEKETIVGDREAIKLMYPEYRDPWKLPAEYL